MRPQYSAIVFSLLLGACAASDDNKSNAPVPPSGEAVATAEGTNTEVNPEPVVPEGMPEASGVAIASIASVQLKQDCPDPKGQAKTDAKQNASASMGFAPSMQDPGPGRSAKSKRKGNGSFRQPCSQSTLQLAFTGQEGSASTATLKAVRLQSAEGKALGTLETRLPTIWKESGYEAWDGTLEPGADHKASYKLSVPDWSEVETALGGSSYGTMYTLEVDVEIQGKVTTLTSPQFERGRPQIIKT